jgi:hypothetical protein
MFGSAVLELAIGMCMVYLMFGGICSTVREYIARAFSQREKLLIAGISRVLGTTPPSEAEIRLHSSANVAKTDAVADPNNLASRVLGHSLIRGLTESGRNPSYIPARTFALALLDVLVPDGKTARTVDSVRAAVAQLPPGKVRDALLPLVNQTAKDLSELQANVERHFDDAMDRVSGIYKRNSQKVIAIIALAVTVLFNVDTFHAAKVLWASPTQRAAVTQRAEDTVKTTTAPSAAPTLSELEQLPIGWYGCPTDTAGWALRLLGWLVTAFALTLGTPFWFDLLTQFVNLRAAGPKPQRSGETAAG